MSDSNILYTRQPEKAEDLPKKALTKKEKKLLKKRKVREDERRPQANDDEEEKLPAPKREDEEEEEEEEEEQRNLFRPDKKKSKVIDVEFELVLPSEAYYHSVRALLSQYLDGEDNENMDLSGLADQVVSTVSIGSVVASPLDQDPAELPEYKDLPDAEFDKVALRYNSQRDVYGFLTVLSVTRRRKQHRAFDQVLQYVLAKAGKHCNERQRELFEGILAKPNVGLLLNERLINLPYELVPQMHESVPEDLKFTKQQDDIEDPREFDYQYLLVITKYAVENKKRGAKGTTGGEEKLYYKAEDEMFVRHAEASFAFKTTFRETLEDGTKKNIVGGGQGAPETQYKLVYLIKYSEYQKRARELQAFLKSLVA